MHNLACQPFVCPIGWRSVVFCKQRKKKKWRNKLACLYYRFVQFYAYKECTKFCPKGCKDHGASISGDWEEFCPTFETGCDITRAARHHAWTKSGRSNDAATFALYWHIAGISVVLMLHVKHNWQNVWHKLSASKFNHLLDSHIFLCKLFIDEEQRGCVVYYHHKMVIFTTRSMRHSTCIM